MQIMQIMHQMVKVSCYIYANAIIEMIFAFCSRTRQPSESSSWDKSHLGKDAIQAINVPSYGVDLD